MIDATSRGEKIDDESRGQCAGRARIANAILIGHRTVPFHSKRDYD